MATNEDELRRVTIGPLGRVNGPIELAEYDPQWPATFAAERTRISTALGDRAIQIEHVGSTSVPGLAAKPIIDILLAVASSADERAYVPDLEAAAYILRIREPAWHEHRMFKGVAPAVNLHVYSQGCGEIDRMLRFRNWLRDHESDRLRYEQAKRSLAQKNWEFVQNYADAKTAVIEGILARAQ